MSPSVSEDTESRALRLRFQVSKQVAPSTAAEWTWVMRVWELLRWLPLTWIFKGFHYRLIWKPMWASFLLSAQWTDNTALSFCKNWYQSLGFIMCWATNCSSSTYYDVWSWLSTWLDWEGLGKLVKNTLLGVSVKVYLETSSMRVGKWSEEEHAKWGHHTHLVL